MRKQFRDDFPVCVLKTSVPPSCPEIPGEELSSVDGLYHVKTLQNN